MPYHGLTFAFLVGVGLATALYFLVEEFAQRRIEAPHGQRRTADDPPPNSWNTGTNLGNDSRRRKGKRTSDSRTTKCSICLEALAGGDNSIRTLRCNHSFHINCIGKWMETSGSNATCPNCRLVFQ